MKVQNSSLAPSGVMVVLRIFGGPNFGGSLQALPVASDCLISGNKVRQGNGYQSCGKSDPINIKIGDGGEWFVV